MATSTDLRSAIEEVQNQLPEGQFAGEVDGLYQADFATKLEQRVGALPWWVISSVVHSVIFLLATLIGVAMPPPNTDEVLITSDIAAKEEPKYDEKKKRDIFKNPQEVKAETEVENPVVIHEQAEVSDTFETDNDMDSQSARGQEDAISDIPLGGTGVTGSMGVGGGGMAGCFGYRNGGGRKRAVARFGGSKATESAVEAALRWLARHQEADGRWNMGKWGGKSARGNVAMTGLATLAFLGAGYTHKAGKYRDNVNRAVKWLLSQQEKNGCMTKESNKWTGYLHAMGALALVEAYGMTRDAKLKEPAQRSVDYSVKVHQHPYGGWRYKPREEGDTSHTGWFIMQLKSAKVAGLSVDGAAFQGGLNFIGKVTSKKTGGTVYTPSQLYDGRPGNIKWARWTAISQVCRLFMGIPRDDELLQKGDAFVLAQKPDWAKEDFYHWYYGTLAMFQRGGDSWKAWNKELKPTLLDNQRKGGPMDGSANDVDGSWDFEKDTWGKTCGRIYTTALGALSLEVYYRYLPMYSK